MSDEQERLVKTINAGIETTSGCVGCYLWALIIAAFPMIAVTLYMIIGYSLSSLSADDLWPVVVGVVVYIVLVHLMGRLMPKRR